MGARLAASAPSSRRNGRLGGPKPRRWKPRWRPDSVKVALLAVLGGAGGLAVQAIYDPEADG
jgi:hypothetical protein